MCLPNLLFVIFSYLIIRMSNITLKEFLKKFTAIPEKFINEYYNFYELCETNKFGIPIKLLVKYLGIAI